MIMDKFWEKQDFDNLLQRSSGETKDKRHQLRYALFRCQNELEGGAKADKEHHETVEEIEKVIRKSPLKDQIRPPIEATFAKGWDIGETLPKVQIVLRAQSVWSDWNQTMAKVSVPLPAVEASSEE